MFEFDISAASRVGCVRENNEDMILVDDIYVRNDVLSLHHDLSSKDRFMIALADGMGGHNCGEVASSDVLHNLQYVFNDIPYSFNISDFNEVIFEWLSSMNNNLEAKGYNDPKYKDMGTTLVSLVYYGNEFYWMNCGDSRLYRLHEGKLVQLTTDHSLNTLMGSKQHTNVITNCIGGGCTTSFIDIVDCTKEVEKGDVFMLCSDGLTDMVDDEVIERMLNEGCDASALCAVAENNGGIDNISVVIVNVQ